MCKQKQCKRDQRQFRALALRFLQYFKLKKSRIIGVFFQTIATLLCLLVACIHYEPATLQMKATEQFHVTATDEMQFAGVESGFTSAFALHNCTLYQRFEIGLVRQDNNGNEEGFTVLQSAFTELAARYAADQATKTNGFEMTARIFSSNDDLDDYVQNIDYIENRPLCYAIAWKEFDAEKHTFSLDLRMNFGDILSPRLPQTEYEESSQNQLYLEEYAHTGMLQTMTTVTSKLLTEIYSQKEGSFKFEMMYMPMDSGTFHNDMFAEVVTALLAFSLLSVANIATGVLSTIQDPDEQKIKEIYRRQGMRKTVEVYFEIWVMLLIMFSLLFPLTSIGIVYLIPTTTYGFFFVQIIIFTVRVVLQSWAIRFTIDSHELAEVVEISFEVLQILLLLYSNTLEKINPQFFLGATFLSPLIFITQQIRLGVIASNKGINVDLGQANVIVNYNDMTTIMYYSMIALSVKCLYLLYVTPIKVLNDPKKLWGPLYLCQPSWWRSREEDNFGVAEGSSFKLHEDERKMVEQGNYEDVPSNEHLHHLQLSHVNVEHGGHHLVHDLSLTVREGETFVLIGENGAGKSAILQTIAGLQHVHSGEATAFGYDLFKAYPFMSDNFLTYVGQEPICIDDMTAEQHIKMSTMFLVGPENIEQKVQRTLAEYNLHAVAKITTNRMSSQDKKMLSFAMSMQGDTRVILLDEPTQGMNLVQKHIVWDAIQRHKKDRVILIATQDMKEARSLGDRIGFISHGALKLCGSPKFFAQKFNHAVQIEFHEFSDADALKRLILSAVKADYHVEVQTDNRKAKIFAKLPLGIQYQTISKCIDMSMLQAGQGSLFKSLKIRSISFAETFDVMLKYIHDDVHHSNVQTSLDQSHDTTLSSNSEQALLMDQPHDQQYEMRRVSMSESLKALFVADFKFKTTVRQMAVIFVLCFIAMGQETLGLFWLTNQEQPSVNFSNIKETFEENGPPILIFTNAKTAQGQSTDTLFSRYKSIVNGEASVEEDAVLIEPVSWVPEAESTVEETMTEAAALYYEEMEKFVEEEEKEAFAAYYVYDINLSTNYYAIGVYGNQLAAASCPTFGATMLQTLAQQVTGNQQIKLEFQNKLLAHNKGLIGQTKPGVAELYGASILAATIIVQIFQVRLFGQPICSGFFKSFIASGGRRSTYFLSKYVKSVLANLILMIICMTLVWAQRFDSEGLSVLLLIWALFNPIFVFFVTIRRTNSEKGHYSRATMDILKSSSVFAIFALFTAGILFYGGFNIGWIFSLFSVYVLNPTFLLLLGSQYSFSYRFLEVKANQDQEVVNLSTWSSNVFAYTLMSFAFGGLIYGGYFWLKYTMRRGEHKECCRYPSNVPPRAERKTDHQQDKLANAESEKVEQLMVNTEEHILVVQDLETFDYLEKHEIDDKAKDGEYSRAVYFHNSRTRGFYTTKRVSFALKHGERLAFLSSTATCAADLFLSIVGQKRPSYGSFVINQLDCADLINNYTALHGVVSFQPRTNAIDEELTVQQHLEIFARIAGIPEHIRTDQISEMTSACLLQGKEATKAGELTHGLLRRLTLGMALIGRPQLVVLQNPIEGVDPLAKNKLVETILKYTEGRALLMSTQDPEVAQNIGDRVAMIHDCRLLSIGSTQEILDENCNNYSLEVQADMNLLSAHEPDLFESESKFIEDHTQAREMLHRIQEKLEDTQAILAFDRLTDEYKMDRQLSDLYRLVEQESYALTREMFINQVLMLNLAQVIIALLPGLSGQVTEIQGDLIQIELSNLPSQFSETHFSAELNEATSGIAISYFSIQASSLASIFSKLISSKQSGSSHDQDDIESSESLQPRFINRARTLAANRVSDNLNDSDDDDSDDDGITGDSIVAPE